ncbi:MAG: ATP cone domain-containing protein, partial [Candidatus Bipolaricaulota bacterium]|nr:ATP cone domain-containing protein [Candidatus Bipolaricaulota bacterium]
MEYIVKRDGRVVPFNPTKITTAVWKAMKEVGEGDEYLAQGVADRVVRALESRFVNEPPTVEEIQDTVEETLIERGQARTAKAYILYRKQHEDLREMHGLLQEMPLVEDYLNDRDWR